MLYTISSILPCLVCLFWTAVYALEWSTSYAAKRILTAFMGVCTLLYLCHAVFFLQNTAYLRIANSVYAACTLAVFPLFYLYILRLTLIRIPKKYLYILLPAVLFGLWAAIVNACCPDDAAAHRLLRMCVRVTFLIELVPVCYYGYRRLKGFDRRVADIYSDTDLRTMKYTRDIMGLMVLCAIFSASANLISREYFYEHSALLVLPSGIFSVLLFCIGYCGLKQGFCIDKLEADLRCTTYQHDGGAVADTDAEPSTGCDNQKLEALESAMKGEKLFLRNDLRLTDVARHIGVSRNALSTIINTRYVVSFSDYINAQRVEHSKSLIMSMAEQHITLTAISEQSGYTTEASFYRAFKKHTGMTPKQWLAKNTEK